MKILITGSSGYVGYVLARHFSEKGVSVVGLSRSPNHAWNGNANFKFYSCDVTEKEKIEAIFAKENPTHVIHLAYIMDPLHDAKREFEIDFMGSVNIMEVSNKTKSVKQFIEMSSASAYGAWPDNKLWIKEDKQLRPRDYRYGINKKQVEEFYAHFHRRKDLRLVVFRMCTLVGPLYHKKGGVVSVLTNSPFLVKFNNRFAEVQFIHEDDLNAIFDKTVKDSRIEGTFNLAPDSYSTTGELAYDKLFIPLPLSLMRGIVRVLWWLHISPLMPAAMTLSTYGIVVDPSKLMKRLNYKFKYSTKEAFFETVKKRKELGTL